MRAWWIDKTHLRAYRPQDRARLFKWVVFTRGNETQLVAMPHDAGWEFHIQGLMELSVRQRWCTREAAEKFLSRGGNGFLEASLHVLGGGVRHEDGSVRNFSYRFGPVPEEEDQDARRTLRLET